MLILTILVDFRIQVKFEVTEGMNSNGTLSVKLIFKVLSNYAEVNLLLFYLSDESNTCFALFVLQHDMPTKRDAYISDLMF